MPCSLRTTSATTLRRDGACRPATITRHASGCPPQFSLKRVTPACPTLGCRSNQENERSTRSTCVSSSSVARAIGTAARGSNGLTIHHRRGARPACGRPRRRTGDKSILFGVSQHRSSRTWLSMRARGRIRSWRCPRVHIREGSSRPHDRLPHGSCRHAAAYGSGLSAPCSSIAPCRAQQAGLVVPPRPRGRGRVAWSWLPARSPPCPGSRWAPHSVAQMGSDGCRTAQGSAAHSQYEAGRRSKRRERSRRMDRA